MTSAFGHPWFLLGLAVLPLLAVLTVRARRLRRRALAHFGPRAAALARSSRLVRIRRIAILFGMVLLGLGAAGPQWGRDWGQTTAPGRDLVVVLDCSRSMFAESPSRLERACRLLTDLATSLRGRGGWRIGLVCFASRPRLVCPLTHDIDHFREAVANVTTDALDPDLDDETSPSGTRIGRALALAVQAHDGTEPGARDILLLSDGHDSVHDGEWQAGATVAKTEHLRVDTIGIGDPEAAHSLGSNRDGDKTRLDEFPLQEIARITDGRYLLVGTHSLALGEYYLSSLAGSAMRQSSPDALPVYRQHQVLFLLPALALLTLGLLVLER
jgi:Ca-activated chloride channel homolog